MVPRPLLEKVLAAALVRGGDFAELFVQDRQSISVGLEDGKVERVQAGRDRGAGLRVAAGELTGYAYADNLSEPSLLHAAQVAAAVAQAGQSISPRALRQKRQRPVSNQLEPPPAAPAARLADLVRAVDQAARELGPSIRQVTVRLAHSRQRVLIANSDGLLARDERRELQLLAAVTAQRNGLLQVARRARGGQAGLELLAGDTPTSLGRETAEVAVALLDARPAPAGSMPVVVSNGWGGVLFHEAVGHGLEADHVVKNSSVYSGKLG